MTGWLAPMVPVLRRVEKSRASAKRKRIWLRNPENRARELRRRRRSSQ